MVGSNHVNLKWNSGNPEKSEVLDFRSSDFREIGKSKDAEHASGVEFANVMILGHPMFLLPVLV